MQKNTIQFLITLEVFTKYHKACELLLSFLDWGNGAAGNAERFSKVSTHALRRTATFINSCARTSFLTALC